MPARRRELPPQLTARPVTLDAARDAGLGRPRLTGVSRLAPRVYSILEPTLVNRLAAHLATLPGDVLVEGVTVVVAGDWLVRLEKTTPAALQEHAATLSGRHARTVRRTAGLVRARVDSPPESRLRLCLVLAGLPEPVCNVDIGDELFLIATPDLAYLVHRLLLEYEGDHHRTDRAQWQKDIKRERQLRKTGYELMRITADTLRRPRELVHDVHTLLVTAGYDGPAPVFTPEWRAFFETGASSGSSGRLRQPRKLPAASTRREAS